MRIIYILLTIKAAFLTILVIGLTIILIANGGGVNLLIPGLGLVISLSFVIVVLAVIDVVIILLALLSRRISRQQKML